MLKKTAATRKKDKAASGTKSRRMRRHAKARVRQSPCPLNYLMEEHPEL
jgi:hypothetical protein